MIVWLWQESDEDSDEDESDDDDEMEENEELDVTRDSMNEDYDGMGSLNTSIDSGFCSQQSAASDEQSAGIHNLSQIPEEVTLEIKIKKEDIEDDEVLDVTTPEDGEDGGQSVEQAVFPQATPMDADVNVDSMPQMSYETGESQVRKNDIPGIQARTNWDPNNEFLLKSVRRHMHEFKHFKRPIQISASWLLSTFSVWNITMII